jgi:MFS family permease
MSATSERPVLDPAQRRALQRRTLRVLALGQVAGAAALGSAVTVGAFVVQGILGHETVWAGIAVATVTTGTAITSQALSGVMRRRGRRPGLQLGYVMASTGAVVAAWGAEHEWLVVFLAGLFVFGSGQAANLLSRYAATDLAEPHERGTAMSRIVFASTFGAVVGPLLIGPAEHLGQELGFAKYTGPWLVSAVCFAAAATNTALRLRPDPLAAAGGTVDSAASPATSRRFVDAARIVAGIPGARLALVAMVVSQVTMVAVMAMTPVHLKLHGHEGVSQYVVSVHIAGMFAFSPLVGRFSDRRGRLAALRAGGLALVASALLAALSGDVEQLLFPALWALGLGWNFGLIGGSSLLVDCVPADERVAVQGAADLMMSLSGGVAGFASGFVRRAVGYHVLAGAAALAAAALLAAVVGARREAKRATTGEWAEGLCETPAL